MELSIGGRGCIRSIYDNMSMRLARYFDRIRHVHADMDVLATVELSRALGPAKYHIKHTLLTSTQLYELATTALMPRTDVFFRRAIVLMRLNFVYGLKTYRM